MIDEAEKLVLHYGIPPIIALLAVAVRLLFSPSEVSALSVVRAIISALFVGGLGTLFLFDVNSISYLAKGAIIGVLAVMSEYILVGTLKLAQIYKDDPERFIRLFRGDKK